MYLKNKYRHAVTIMLDIMCHSETHSLPLRVSDMADKHAISISYIENLFVSLVNAALVKGMRGPNGGYTLGKAPHQITVAEIVRAVSAPNKFNDCGKADCRHGVCIENFLWENTKQEIDLYLSHITLSDLVASKL